jgi:transcription elongation factor GreA
VTTPGSEPITAEGLRELEAELQRLETEGRRAMSERIQVAREMGDLKENAEYHIAKDDQAHLETKIRRLRERLVAARVVEAEDVGEGLAFGRTAEVLDETTGRVHTWTIVGATEADPSAGRIASESPVAQALLGRAEGDHVNVQTPGGKRTYVIQKIVAR